MAEIVNLRRVRKTRERLAAADEAAAQRLLHGRTRAERDASDKQRRVEAKRLDDAKLDGNGKAGE